MYWLDGDRWALTPATAVASLHVLAYRGGMVDPSIPFFMGCGEDLIKWEVCPLFILVILIQHMGILVDQHEWEWETMTVLDLVTTTTRVEGVLGLYVLVMSDFLILENLFSRNDLILNFCSQSFLCKQSVYWVIFSWNQLVIHLYVVFLWKLILYKCYYFAILRFQAVQAILYSSNFIW